MGISKLRQKVKEKEKGGLQLAVKDGDNDVRILPNKYEPELVFKEAWVYYAGKNSITNMTMFSPKTWGEEDPVYDFVIEQTQGNNLPKDEYFRIINLAPKPVYMVPVVLRGKEQELGVKWLVLSGGKHFHGDFELKGQFGKVMENYEMVFRSVLKKDKEVDFTDIEKGHDLLIKKIPAEKTDNEYGEIKYQFEAISSTLLPEELVGTKEGKELLNEWINEQPSWEGVYPRKSTQDIADMFDKYTAGLDDIDDSEMDEEDAEEVTYDSDDYDTEDIIADAEAMMASSEEDSDTDQEENKSNKKENVEELVTEFDEDDDF